MRLGTPTVVSNAGSLPEVCGEGAYAVSPDDADALAAQLARLVASQEERARWSERGRAQAAKFTWERAARETIARYRAALEGA